MVQPVHRGIVQVGAENVITTPSPSRARYRRARSGTSPTGTRERQRARDGSACIVGTGQWSRRAPRALDDEAVDHVILGARAALVTTPDLPIREPLGLPVARTRGLVPREAGGILLRRAR